MLLLLIPSNSFPSDLYFADFIETFNSVLTVASKNFSALTFDEEVVHPIVLLLVTQIFVIVAV